MVLKILEDNRLLKEGTRSPDPESDKLRNTLKAKTKQLSQLQDTVRNQMHYIKNQTPNPAFNDPSPRAASPRLADVNESKKAAPKLQTIKISPAAEVEEDSSAGGAEKRDSNGLKKSGFSSSGTAHNNTGGALDSPKNNQSVKFKEEGGKKGKKESFSKAVESEKQAQARSSVNFSNLKPKKENKKSVFKIIAEEQQNRHNLFVMNDNSLPSLIFSDLEGQNDASPQNEIKMLEKLLLKNTNIAVLNNLLSNKGFFVKVILQMTEGHVNHLYDTLKQLYIEIVELLRGARKIRSIFDSAPQIISSMSIEVRTAHQDAMKAVVDFICDSLECERATVFAMDKINNELWSKVAKGSLSLRQAPRTPSGSP